ncbi:MAG: hypothetical protein M1818_005569 [Claussenomyces sp. TS43310]|nr:MAG: hypothetical protein M1818_005569 [Claussenomyces sp. TS43310]
MQFLTLIAVFAAVASAAVLPRQNVNGNFSITDFSISGSHYSDEIAYRFNVTDNQTSTRCNTTIASINITTIAPTCCEDDGTGVACQWKFSFLPVSSKAADGYALNVTTYSPPSGPKTFDTASVFINQDNITTAGGETDPNGKWQYLDWPTDFTMPFYTYPRSG